MKLSNKIINICKKYYNPFNICIDCPIQTECENYRACSIRSYEEFQVRYNEIMIKINSLNKSTHMKRF